MNRVSQCMHIRRRRHWPSTLARESITALFIPPHAGHGTDCDPFPVAKYAGRPEAFRVAIFRSIGCAY